MFWYELSECWVLEPEQGEQRMHAVVDGTHRKVYLSFVSLHHKEKGIDKFGKGERAEIVGPAVNSLKLKLSNLASM